MVAVVELNKPKHRALLVVVCCACTRVVVSSSSPCLSVKENDSLKNIYIHFSLLLLLPL